jgi:L-fuculose-phosphate aldolase
MTRAPEDPRVEIARTMRQIYDLGLTTTSGGNLSIRGDAGELWVTPARLDKGELRPDQVVRVDEAGVTGPPPSSELPFHRAIYAMRPDLGAIVHAHPVALVAFSITGRLPDTRVCADAHSLCGAIGFAPYALPGSERLGEHIATAFSQGADCVVLENHGVVVGGRSLRHAFARFEAFESCARTILRARRLGGERPLTEEDLELGRRAASRPASSTRTRSADHASSDHERTLRETICHLTLRAYRRRLITSTQGLLSARCSEDAFLATPPDRSLDRLEPADLLRLPIDDADRARLEPESAVHARLHAALYRAHPQVGAIAQGHPESAGGFSVAGVPLPSRTIPESYIVIREPGFIPFRTARTDPDAVVRELAPDRPVALIQNDGALALGSDLLDAFDRLEVLEATAAAVIESVALGDLAAMSDERIRELRDTFFPGGGL